MSLGANWLKGVMKNPSSIPVAKISAGIPNLI